MTQIERDIWAGIFAIVFHDQCGQVDGDRAARRAIARADKAVLSLRLEADGSCVLGPKDVRRMAKREGEDGGV